MKAIRREPNLLRLTGPIGCGKSVAVTTFVAALDNDRYTPLVSTRLRPLRGRSRQGTLERVDEAHLLIAAFFCMAALHVIH